MGRESLRNSNIKTIGGGDKILTKNSKGRLFDGVSYETTGCMAVDMVSCFMEKARNARIPVKSITLSNANYDKYDDYFRLNHIKDEELRDENNETRRYSHDGVPIHRAGWQVVDNGMIWELFPTQRTEENMFENRNKVDYSSLSKSTDLPDVRVKTIITNG